MRKAFALFAPAVLLAGASAALAALPVADGGSAAKAVQDCAAATSADAVDTNVLIQRGWKAAKYEQDGEAVEAEISIFGKERGAPIVMLSEDAAVCVVVGGLASTASFAKLRSAFGEAFADAGSKDGDFRYMAGRDFVLLKPTGSKQQPAFRATVVELGDR